MKDSERYAARAQELMRLAYLLRDETERQACLQLASAYVDLARESATFEVLSGGSLSGDGGEPDVERQLAGSDV